MLPAATLGVALAYYAPLLLESRAMLDAARSRHSLNRRAVMMVQQHPLLGSGAGTHTVIEQSTFPDYRVNGVDAHGVVQKIGGELGLLGLIGYGWFTLSVAGALRRRFEADGRRLDGLSYGAAAMWGVSTAGLLLSTETFSQTWWAPLAVSWGLAHHKHGGEG
ncbi:MAG: O-antigen ligase [Myxococcota bacterium]